MGSDFISILFDAVEPQAISAMYEQISKENATLVAKSHSFLSSLDSLITQIDNTEKTKNNLQNAHKLLAQSARDLFNSVENPFVGTIDLQRMNEFKNNEHFTQYRKAIGELNYRTTEVLQKYYGKKGDKQRDKIDNYIQQATVLSTNYRNDILTFVTGEEYSEQIVFSVEGTVVAVTNISLAASTIFQADKASKKNSASKLGNKKLNDIIARINTDTVLEILQDKDKDQMVKNLEAKGLTIIDPNQLIKPYLEQINKIMESLNSVTSKDKNGKDFKIEGMPSYNVKRGPGGKYIITWDDGNKQGIIGNHGDLEEIYLSILMQSKGNKFLKNIQNDFLEGFITATHVDAVPGLFTGDFDANGIEYSAKSHGASLAIIQQAQTLAHQIIGLGADNQHISNLIKTEMEKSKQDSSGSSGNIKARNKVIDFLKEEFQQLFAF